MNKYFVVFFVVFFFGFSANAEKESKLTFLSGDLLFKEPLAYKRTPEFSFFIKNSNCSNIELTYYDASIGKTFPIFTYEKQEMLTWQLVVGAGTWVTLGYKDGSFPVVTQDFLISTGTTVKSEDLSFSVKWNHISAHLGDGANIVVDSSLISDFNSYSRDFISFHWDKNWNKEYVHPRLYIQGGYAYKNYPKNLGRTFVGSGFEIIVQEAYLTSPYIAADMTYNGDVDSFDFSFSGGFFLLNKTDNWSNLRMVLTYYKGSDRRGKMFGNKLREIGVGLILM